MVRFFIRFKVAVTAIFLLIFCMITMSSKINTEKFYFRTFLFDTLYKIENIFVVTFESIQRVFINVKQIQDLEEKLANAEQRLLNYRELTFLHEQIQQENKQLRTLLGLKSKLVYSAYYSEIVFRDPTLLADYVIINKGSKDGISLNMPVVYSSEQDKPLVLVGRIVEVSQHISKVRLISARNLYLSVRLEETGYTGVLKGQGSWNQNLLLDYIPVNSSINIDESIVTSGESRIYPPNLLIGHVQGTGHSVTEEFFQTIYVRPAFNYKKIKEVFVLDYKNEESILELTEDAYER